MVVSKHFSEFNENERKNDWILVVDYSELETILIVNYYYFKFFIQTCICENKEIFTGYNSLPSICKIVKISQKAEIHQIFVQFK